MGCALVAGTVSGGLLERHQKLEAARTVAEQQAAERQKQLVEQRATVAVTDEALLAGVDSDVSREVPSAMEPLAQMMSYDGSK
jgi:plasmid replication initiation protein